jgi:hypothetical protein
MDANKIKFVDDDGSVEVVEPPMTARVHVETPTEELIPQDKVLQETIEEESSSSEEDIVVIRGSDISSSVEGTIEGVIEGVSGASGQVSITEDAVEQNVKDLAKIDTILSSSVEAMQPPSASIIEGSNKIDEVKGAVANGGNDEIDKEALSLVANAVNDVRADERVPITPKGCCILQ